MHKRKKSFFSPFLELDGREETDVAFSSVFWKLRAR
jgi:hypothetical protein